MHTSNYPKSHPLKFYFDPFETYFYKRHLFLDNDLIFFVDSAASYVYASPSDLLVIGGRGGDILSKSGKSFIDSFGFPKAEESTLIDAIYHSNESAFVIPLKHKILAINNRLFRACGLGTAFIFNYPPSVAAAIAQDNYSKSLNNVKFSSSFENIAPDYDNAMNFINSLLFFNEHLDLALGQGLSYSVNGYEGISEMITAAATVIGCPLSITLSSDKDYTSSINGPLLAAFTLCLLSEARKISSDRRASVGLDFGDHCTVIIDYTVSKDAPSNDEISEISLCNTLARELNVPFRFDIYGDRRHAEFIPFKLDPSAVGLKAGIFIDGMPFMGR